MSSRGGTPGFTHNITAMAGFCLSEVRNSAAPMTADYHPPTSAGASAPNIIVRNVTGTSAKHISAASAVGTAGAAGAAGVAAQPSIADPVTAASAISVAAMTIDASTGTGVIAWRIIHSPDDSIPGPSTITASTISVAVPPIINPTASGTFTPDV
eukprot:IDg16932t1